jgi:glycosyltransferase involved in cell wall biosynthesis
MPKRILYIEGNTDGTVGGSYFLMYDLVSRLDRTRFEPIVGFHRDNYLVEKFRALGVETIVFPGHNPWLPKNFLFKTLLSPIKKLVNLYRGVVGPARAYARFLRERKIDLVNLNNSITRNHHWMIAARMTGTRCMTHEMGICLKFSPLSRYLGKRLDSIICLSHAIHDNMKSLGVDYPNTTVIHCGIDLDRYKHLETPEQLRAKHNIPADSEVTGVVGNIRKWKGQEVMVRAAALLKKRFPRVRVMLVGDCGEADKGYGRMLDRLCEELGVKDTVVFTGFQKNAIDYMRLMDVVGHTSIHPEPFGIVTLEAMSLAKPLVSTTIGGPAEVVLNGETGLLVEAGKPELLAEALGSLLADRAKAMEFGRRGLERLHQHFGIRKNIDATEAVYRRILRLPDTPRASSNSPQQSLTT